MMFSPHFCSAPAWGMCWFHGKTPVKSWHRGRTTTKRCADNIVQPAAFLRTDVASAELHANKVGYQAGPATELMKHILMMLWWSGLLDQLLNPGKQFHSIVVDFFTDVLINMNAKFETLFLAHLGQPWYCQKLTPVVHAHGSSCRLPKYLKLPSRPPRKW